MDFKALLALTLILVVVVRFALIICCTSKTPGDQVVKSRDQVVEPELFPSRDWSRLLAKWLRAIGMALCFSFGVVWLCHNALGTSLTCRVTLVILLFIVALEHVALFLRTGYRSFRWGSNVYAVSGLTFIMFAQILSISCAISLHESQLGKTVAQYMALTSATIIQSGITALSLFNTKKQSFKSKIDASLLYLTIVYSNLKGIIPFWMWATRSQQGDLTGLGIQVIHLVVTIWPTEYEPLTLLLTKCKYVHWRKDGWSSFTLLPKRRVQHGRKPSPVVCPLRSDLASLKGDLESGTLQLEEHQLGKQQLKERVNTDTATDAGRNEKAQVNGDKLSANPEVELQSPYVTAPKTAVVETNDQPTESPPAVLDRFESTTTLSSILIVRPTEKV